MTQHADQKLQAILRARDMTISRLRADLEALRVLEHQRQMELEDKQAEIETLAHACAERLRTIETLNQTPVVPPPAHGAQPDAPGPGAFTGEGLLAERIAGLESQFETLLATLDERFALPDEASRHIALLQEVCDARQKVIEEQQRVLQSLHVRLYARLLALGRVLLQPKLGVLNQHPPIPMLLPASYWAPVRGGDWPKISLVTPSYMQGEYLEQTLLSVLDQQYPNLEYFVQDGASTDATAEILRRHEQRLLGWESRPDKGQSNAINLGFAHTNGEIMAWLNSDDLLLPGALAHVGRYFATHPEVDVVYGNRLLIDSQGRQIGRWVLPGHDGEVLLWADFVPQETLFWRRSIWDKAGGAVDETFHFAVDWDLILRMREAKARFRHLPRHLGAFRVHTQQKTSATISDVGFAEMDRLRERCHGRTVEHPEIARRLAPFMLRHLLADCMDRVRFRLTTLRVC